MFAVQVPANYTESLQNLKSRIRDAQIRLFCRQRRTGYSLLVDRKAPGWGTEVIDRLSHELQLEFLGVVGYSRGISGTCGRRLGFDWIPQWCTARGTIASGLKHIVVTPVARMTKPKRSPTRENRIHEQIIVDSNGPEEQAMSWYYYLEAKLRFPFHTQCTASRPTSPLVKAEPVEVRGLASEDTCTRDMLVMIRWKGRNMAVPLSQLKAAGADESTRQAIEDWHYWVARGYYF